MDIHRKQVRGFPEPGDCHELTFSCYRRLPLLTHDVCRRMLAESLDRATSGHGFRLTAFVFMPEHVHLLVDPTSRIPRIDWLLKAIKRPFSTRVKQRLVAARTSLLKTLTAGWLGWRDATPYAASQATPSVYTNILQKGASPAILGISTQPVDATRGPRGRAEPTRSRAARGAHPHR
jgi:REP element-mobilizing transposase RayT